LLDKELISQHGTDKVVIKEVLQENVFSNEENREFFLQEVSLTWFVLFYLFFFEFIMILFFKLKIYLNRSCSFHVNVVKLIGYVLEPEYCIVTKRYELDLFHFIHHPNEDLPPLLALKLSK